MNLTKHVSAKWALFTSATLTASLVPVSGESVIELTAFPVFAGSMEPAGIPSEFQLADRMQGEVRVDLQSRGGSRYQSDISVRGGIFEGTGLKIGGLSLFDPQTGHYFSEIPLDPVFFSGARLLTGVSNSLYGFNSTAGSIDWAWRAIEPGGSLTLTMGSDSLFGFRASASGNVEAASWQLAVMKEEGDGSVDNGDFDLRRISGRIEFTLGNSQLRFFGGYTDKFYGWPGMYTGFPLNETDDYQVSLLGFQWTAETDFGQHRVGGYWRRLDDDYEFRREEPNAFFEHLTEVWGLEGDGSWSADALELSYHWIFVKDEIVRSTSLVNGAFSEREYGEAAVMGQYTVNTDFGLFVPYAGIGLETSNRDSTVGSPFGGFRLSGSLEDGAWEAYAEYAQASQVPGYTVLNSATSGLFGGNPDLGREHAETLEGGLSVQKGALAGRIAVFQRDDRDLVDWVFDPETPNARQAATADITVTGIETLLRWDWSGGFIEAGYAFLDKDPEYAEDPESTSGRSSFYALNYARHRFIGSIGQTYANGLRWRLEAEYRDQAPNQLRSGPDSALFVHAELVWVDFPADGWDLLLRGDNLTDEEFQQVPGTPGSRREGQVTVRYSW